MHAGVVVAMRLPDRAVREQPREQGGGPPLRRVRPRIVDAGIERHGCAPHRLEAHRGRGVRAAPQHPGVMNQERGEPGLRLSAVDERQSFFRFQRDRRQAGSPHPRPVATLSDHREGEVRQGGQVARSADAPLRGHRGMNAGIEHADDQLGEDGPDAARAEQQDVGAQQHHRAHGLLRQRIADPRRVAADQVQLQPAQVAGGDPHVGELPEPRRHAVHRLAAGDGVLHDAPRRFHALHGSRGDLDRDTPASDRDDVLNREGMTVQHHGCKHARKKLSE